MENKQLDEKWIELIEELIQAGVSKDDFRDFLESKKAVTDNQNTQYTSS